MSYLNISLPGFGNVRTGVQRGKPLRKLSHNLHVLARAVLLALNSKETALAAGQLGELETSSECIMSVQDPTQGCRAHVSDAEYQHLVELGQWHHRRQRRRARWR